MSRTFQFEKDSNNEGRNSNPARRRLKTVATLGTFAASLIVGIGYLVKDRLPESGSANQKEQRSGITTTSQLPPMSFHIENNATQNGGGAIGMGLSPTLVGIDSKQSRDRVVEDSPAEALAAFASGSNPPTEQDRHTLEKARAAQSAKRLKDAVALYESLSAIGGSVGSEAHYHRGEILLNDFGKLQEAAAEFGKAIECDPTYAAPHVALAAR